MTTVAILAQGTPLTAAILAGLRSLRWRSIPNRSILNSPTTARRVATCVLSCSAPLAVLTVLAVLSADILHCTLHGI